MVYSGYYHPRNRGLYNISLKAILQEKISMSLVNVGQYIQTDKDTRDILGSSLAALH